MADASQGNGLNEEQRPRAFNVWVKSGIRLGALVLVVFGIGHFLHNSTDELAQQQEKLERQASELLRKADRTEDATEAERLRSRARTLLSQAQAFWCPSWSGLCSACCFAMGAMLPAGVFWRRCLVEMDQVHHVWDTLWAYFYGNLGRYVPGKALVLVLRIASLANHQVKKTVVVMTIFVETLTNMAVGCAMAAACLIWLDIDWRLSVLAAVMVLVTWIPVSPPLLQFLLPRLQKGVASEELERWTSRIRWPLFFRGWVMLSLGWLLYGLSLLWVLQSLPAVELESSDWMLVMASAMAASALAIVLGFLSLIPAGAGVRELIISAVLSPVVGPVAAVCAAFWWRIVCLVGELVWLVILFLIRRAGATHPAQGYALGPPSEAKDFESSKS